MGVNVISMLTNNDVTVPDARRIFEENKHSKVRCWGFKDTGIEEREAIKLVGSMKDAGMTTFLEPLIEEEEGLVKAARLAVSCKFDYVVGVQYSPRVLEILNTHGIQYYPTCGRREGMPRMLYGTVDSIIEHAQHILDDGADGICLSVYRYVDGDPEDMAIRFVKELDKPFMVTGSINNNHRLGVMKKLNPWGFTIGSALFNDDFGAEKSIAEKLDYLQDFMNTPEREKVAAR